MHTVTTRNREARTDAFSHVTLMSETKMPGATTGAIWTLRPPGSSKEAEGGTGIKRRKLISVSETAVMFVSASLVESL